jgi:hypothetical protein
MEERLARNKPEPRSYGASLDRTDGQAGLLGDSFADEHGLPAVRGWNPGGLW